MRRGFDAWLILVQPVSHLVAMEADKCAGAGEGFDFQAKSNPWKNLVAEFADVFDPPGMP